MDSETFTEIDYMYRDPDKYKFHGSFAVTGRISESQLEPLPRGGEWFVPKKIGLPHLLDMPMYDSNHVLHELTDFSQCSKKKTLCSAQELIKLFDQNHRNGCV